MKQIIVLIDDSQFELYRRSRIFSEEEAVLAVQEIALDAFLKKIKDIDYCQCCGKVFRKAIKTQMFCSLECAGQVARMQPDLPFEGDQDNG